MKESLDAALARQAEATAAMNRLSDVVERLVDVVESREGKVEIRELGYKNDLLTVRREHTDVLVDFVAELREIKGDVKDALGLRKNDASKEDPWAARIKAVLGGPTVKFAIVLVVLGLVALLAIAEGWIGKPPHM